MLAANGAVHGPKFGFERPNYFLRNGAAPSVVTFGRAALAPVGVREHQAIREGVALSDMSSFAKVEIAGQGARRYFQWLVVFSSRRRHTRFDCDWSSDVCSSD